MMYSKAFFCVEVKRLARLEHGANMDRVADLIPVWVIHLRMIHDSMIFVYPSNSEYSLIPWLCSEHPYSEACKSWQDIST